MIRFDKVRSQFFCYFLKVIRIPNLKDNLHLKKINHCVHARFIIGIHQQ